MIGYDRPILRATLPIVQPEFDKLDEHDLPSMGKSPSLDEMDHDGLDGEDCEERLHLERWGDLRVPDRLILS